MFQVSASRSDIEEAEEVAMQNEQAHEQKEEGLFDMVTPIYLFIQCHDFVKVGKILNSFISK